MQKLIRQIFIFLLPVALLLYVMPIDQRRQYAGLQNDCENRGIWIFDRLTSDQPLDIAFVGSSHTINGINDSLLTKLTGENVVNLGYCRLGRNLQYVLIKELLQKKNPEILFLEIDRRENIAGHPIFPYVANTNDAVFGDIFLNRGYFSDAWLHFNYKLEIVQEEIYNKATPRVNDSLFGIQSHPLPADPKFLNEMKEKRRNESTLGNPFDEFVRTTFGLEYVARISELCKNHGVQLYFLYLPGFGEPNEETLIRSRYEKWGSVLFPPDSILSNEINWHDEDHLDQEGALQMAFWLNTVIPDKK